jgi:hypothetical protein
MRNARHAPKSRARRSPPSLRSPGPYRRRGYCIRRAVAHRYRGKLELHEGDPGHASLRATHIGLRRRLRLAAIAAERQRLRELRAANVINDETQRVIEEELDERELISSTRVNRG